MCVCVLMMVKALLKSIINVLLSCTWRNEVFHLFYLHIHVTCVCVPKQFLKILNLRDEKLS